MLCGSEIAATVTPAITSLRTLSALKPAGQNRAIGLLSRRASVMQQF